MGLKRVILIAAIGCCVIGGAGGAYVFAPTPTVAPATPESIDLTALDAVPESTWAALRTKRIYFGHQSVGGNIINGVEEILRKRPAIGLRVSTTNAAGAFTKPGLYHGGIGSNENVKSKLESFADAIDRYDGSIDVAFMKFCYADLKRDSAIGPGALVAQYAETISAIQSRHPTLRLLHCTMPLTWLQSGPKARVKRLLGIMPGADNIARHGYNVAIQAAFDAEAIFDLAASESHAPDGSAESIEQESVAYPCLHRAYTDDGGHLNAGGRLAVARDFLLFLAAQAGPTK
jgi:hypothetical protein